MITLYRKSEDDTADRIEERFKSLVLAYQTKIDDSVDHFFIMDGDEKIEPGEQMEAWFRQLSEELEWSRSLSGDGCFINPATGKVC